MFSLVILVQVCWQQFSQPLFIWIYLFLTFISEYFHLSNSRIEIFFSFYHYKDFIPFTPNLHCFWWEINSRSPHFSSVCNAFFSRVRVNERFTAAVATLCEAYSGGRELLGSSSESSEVRVLLGLTDEAVSARLLFPQWWLASALYHCQSWPQAGFLTLCQGKMAFASVPSLAAMFLGKFSAPSPGVDSLCLLLSTRPMVGTGEVSCPSLLCSFSYCPPPSSRHLLHLLFPPEIVDPCINAADWNFLPVPQQLKTLFAHMKEGSEEVMCPALPALSFSQALGGGLCKKDSPAV